MIAYKAMPDSSKSSSPTAAKTARPTPEVRKAMYQKMLRIRRVEEAVADAYKDQQMKCPVHLSIGQEAVPVGICEYLSIEDRVYSTHRCHAHYLAKEGGIYEMIAELHGKVTGCARGKGGSMHLVDHKKGMMGSSALVAGTIPLAVGSAMAFSLAKKPLVSIAFFGDGATEEGIFYESLNFAALRKLPVIFACENNTYATYSHQSARQATTTIHRRALAFDIPAENVDGNNIEAIYAASGRAVERARSGQGPTLLEFATYRYRDHVGPAYDYEIGYRTKAEVDAWMAKCPITQYGIQLKQEGILTDAEQQAMEAALKTEIEQAFIGAKNDPTPDPKEIFTDIYA